MADNISASEPTIKHSLAGYFVTKTTPLLWTSLPVSPRLEFHLFVTGHADSHRRMCNFISRIVLNSSAGWIRWCTARRKITLDLSHHYSGDWRQFQSHSTRTAISWAILTATPVSLFDNSLGKWFLGTRTRRLFGVGSLGMKLTWARIYPILGCGELRAG